MMKKIKLPVVLLIFLGILVYYFFPERKLNVGQSVDKISIYKKDHELHLSYKNRWLATYKVSLSKKGLAKKKIKGDNLTPEGTFKGKKRAKSRFHKAIEIGQWGGCCNVLIHGLGKEFGWVGKFHRWIDMTEGCIALTNEEIDEIYSSVNDSVIIEINP
jgi:murein L,D-transpeptidase YafK